MLQISSTEKSRPSRGNCSSSLENSNCNYAKHKLQKLHKIMGMQQMQFVESSGIGSVYSGKLLVGWWSSLGKKGLFVFRLLICKTVILQFCCLVWVIIGDYLVFFFLLDSEMDGKTALSLHGGRNNYCHLNKLMLYKILIAL